MLEAGDYRARAVKAQLGKAKSGNPQIGVEFELLDFTGQRIGWYGSFSDAAFDITMRGLTAAGFHGADVSDVSWVEGAPEVVLVVAHEEWEGKTRAKVKFINSPGGVNMKDALVGNEAKSFADRMKGRVLAYQSSAGAPKPAARPAAPRPAARPAGFSDVPQEVLDKQEAGAGGGGPDDIPF